MHILPAFLIMLLTHLHLTVLEPAIRDAIVIAKNPVVRRDVKAAVKIISAYEQRKKAQRQR